MNTIKFDVNFLNFEDPDVLERFTGPDYEKYMKNTFGFDYTMRYDARDHEAMKRKITKHCAESEFRLFYFFFQFFETLMPGFTNQALTHE